MRPERVRRPEPELAADHSGPRSAIPSYGSRIRPLASCIRMRQIFSLSHVDMTKVFLCDEFLPLQRRDQIQNSIAPRFSGSRASRRAGVKRVKGTKLA